MENIMKDFVEVLKNNPSHAYDFIANNYYKMSKEELASVAKELLYAIYWFHKEEEAEILESVSIELEDNMNDD